MLNLKDCKGNSLKEGDRVKITMLDAFKKEFILRQGIIQYRDNVIGSYGAGFGILQDNGKFNFLACISSVNTKLSKC